MSIVSDLLAGGIQGVLSAAGGFARDVRAAITGEEVLTAAARAALLNKAADLEAEAARIEAGLPAAQIEVNKVEAASTSLFVAGWRPFCGWVCGSALAYNFILQPFLAFFITLYKWQAPPLPSLDIGALMTVLLGMLGLGGLRSYEKVQGVSREQSPKGKP